MDLLVGAKDGRVEVEVLFAALAVVVELERRRALGG